MEEKQKIICQSHKNQKCEFLFLKQHCEGQDNFQFLCKKCIILGEFSKGFFIDIDQIFNSISSKEIIHNWPPLNEKQIYTQLENIMNRQNNQQSLIQKIEKQYNQIKNYFNEKIDEYYKYILNKINLYSQDYIKSIYNQKCGVEELKEIFTVNNQIDYDKLKELINLQFKNQEINANLLNIAMKQYSLTQFSEVIFGQLNKKLEILFSKIDSKYLNDQVFTNLMEEKSQEKIEKINFVNEANKKLKSLDINIQFQWQSFEELQNGIQIESWGNGRNIFFTKGFSIKEKRPQLQHLLSNYSWWVYLPESFSNSGNRYITLYYNKKAKNYQNSKNQKPSTCISFDSESKLVDQGEQLAQQLKNRVDEINNKYCQKQI
ncbi:hypothetical protein ABPG72_003076 [Tetrahymena utriculariae]